MARNKDPFSINCNLCFHPATPLTNLFGPDLTNSELKDTMIISLPEVDFDPNMILYVCKNCMSLLAKINQFRQMCIKNVMILKSYKMHSESYMHIEETNLMNGANGNFELKCETEVQFDVARDSENVPVRTFQDESTQTTISGRDLISKSPESTIKVVRTYSRAAANSVRQLKISDVRSESSTKVTNSVVPATSEVTAKQNQSDKNSYSATKTQQNGGNTIIGPSESSTVEIDLTLSDEEPDAEAKRVPRKEFLQNGITSKALKTFKANTAVNMTNDKKVYVLIQKENGSRKILLLKAPRTDAPDIKEKVEDDEDCQIVSVGDNSNANAESQRDVTESISFYCSVCGNSFPNAKDLELHKRRHKKLYECLKCKKHFQFLITYNVHQMGHIRKILKTEMRNRACRMTVKFKKRTKPTNQPTQTPKPQQNGKELVHCDSCSTDFEQELYEEHIKLYTHFCSSCNKHFPSNSVLRVHRKTTCHVTLQYKCSVCEKRFSRKNYLSLHERAHKSTKCNLSNGLKPKRHNVDNQSKSVHSCQLCNKSFLNADSLHAHELRHVKKAISKVPYTCKFCGKSYVRIYNLNKHKCVNQLAKPKPNDSRYCNICDQAFTTIYSFQQHLRLHQLDPTPNFSCSICKKVFGEKESLKKHKRTHVKLTHQCDVCGEKCINLKTLKHHKNILHRNEV